MKELKQTEIAAMGILRAEIAKRFDLPNLARAQAVTVGRTMAYAAEEKPTGQIAGIVRELDVKLALFIEEDGLNIFARLHYRYAHIGGGNNGFQTEFVAVLERNMLNDDAVIVDYMTREAYHLIRNRAAMEVHKQQADEAAAKAKGGK